MTLRSPVLSVVMPVHNQEEFVLRAVNSILRQSFGDFEFVIVDDGSTDDTPALLAGISDSRTRVLTTPHAGVIGARTIGVNEAKGPWVAMMDADDISHPDRLRLQMEFLASHPECSFVGCVWGIVTMGDRYLTPRSTFDWQYLAPHNVTTGSPRFADPSAVFARDRALAAGLYDPEFENEKSLWYRLLADSSGAVLGTPLYYWRWRLGSHSRSRFVSRNQIHRRMRERYDPENAAVTLPPLQPIDATRAALGATERSVDYHLVAGDLTAARKMAFQTWIGDPLAAGPVKILLRALLGRRSLRVWRPREDHPEFVPAEDPWARTGDTDAPAIEFLSSWSVPGLLYRWSRLLHSRSLRGAWRAEGWAKRMIGKGYIRVPYFDGGSVWSCPNNIIGKEVCRGITYEPGVATVIQTYVHASYSYVDVGANIGLHVALAALNRRSDDQRFYAFEPEETAFMVLLRNCRINGLDFVVTQKCAVGDGMGTATLFVSPTRNQGAHSLFGGDEPGWTARTVQMTTLDDALLPQWGSRTPTLIKIDVEGAEREVVAGAARWLAAMHDVALICEVLPNHLQRRDRLARDHLLRTLREIGFDIRYRIIDRYPGRGEPGPEGSRNFLFVKGPSAADIAHDLVSRSESPIDAATPMHVVETAEVDLRIKG